MDRQATAGMMARTSFLGIRRGGLRMLALLLGGMLALAGCKPTGNDLLRAVEADNAPAVQKLLGKGVDPNSADQRGYPALYFAAFRGNIAIVQMLLDKGANVNAKGDTGYTPLHGAAMGGHEDVAELLIEKGADVSARSVHGITPRGEARDQAVIELLKQHGG